MIQSTGEENPAAKHDGSKNRQQQPPWSAKVTDGTLEEVARSAAQAAVRDGDEVAGIYWIKQLYSINRNVWKMFAIFYGEEVGVADLSVKTHILELHRLAGMCKDERKSDMLDVVNAVLILCRAKKSRAADNAIVWFDQNPTYVPRTPQEIEYYATADLPQPVIPDKVYDKHTTEGRRRGRGLEHFLAEKAQLANESDVAPFTPPTTTLCPHCSGTGKVPA